MADDGGPGQGAEPRLADQSAFGYELTEGAQPSASVERGGPL
jgi:hypothetical protein